MSRTMTEKWPSTALAAPMPTTLPSSTLTTGTVDSCSAYIVLPRWPGRNEPPPPATRGRPGLDGARALLRGALALRAAARAPSPRRCRRPTSRRAGGPTGTRSSHRQPVEVEALRADRAVGVAAARREVVGAHDRGAALDRAPAADVIGRREVGDGALVVVGGEAGDAARPRGTMPSSRSSAMRSRQVSLPRLRWRTTPGSSEPGARRACAMRLQGRDLVEDRRPATGARGGTGEPPCRRAVGRRERRPPPGRRRPRRPARVAGSAATTPAHGATTAVSIFIALTTSSVSPARDAVALAHAAPRPRRPESGTRRRAARPRARGGARCLGSGVGSARRTAASCRRLRASGARAARARLTLRR